MRLTLALCTAVISLTFVVLPAIASDDAETITRASMLTNTCAGCHGFNGVSVGPATPTISGFAENNLKQMMKNFREGTRPATAMGRIARGYSDEDIDLIAKTFASMKFVPAKQDFDAEGAKRGSDLHGKHCAICHVQNGTVDLGGAGVIAGQWKEYLRINFEDFLQGAREAPSLMIQNLEAVKAVHGEQGLEDLLDFYASHQ